MIKGFIRNIFLYLIDITSSKKNGWFYDEFFGGSKNPLLFLMSIFNIRALRRYIDDFIFFWRRHFLKRSKIRKQLNLSIRESDYVARMEKDGFVKLEENFGELADLILEDYKTFFQSQPLPSNNYSSLDQGFDQTTNALKASLNPLCIKILTGYGLRNIFLRSCPSLVITYPNRNDIPTSERKFFDKETLGEWSDMWHLDGVQLIQFHMLLSDVEETDPHMLYAKGSNHYNPKAYVRNIPSDDFINSNFEVLHGTGKKGDVYLFDGSRGWHRLLCSNGRKRLTFHSTFTNGLNIIAKKYPVVNLKSLDFSSITPMQKKVLKFFKV